ncbi:MAG: hypothetical protein MI810_13415 [Flavobacteriales bacterium]|nr:hypothetical protein [Flavobacteriales bacterium]
MKQFAVLFFCLTSLTTINAQTPLQHCWNKQLKPVQKKHITFSFSEKRNELEHSFEPWQQTTYEVQGTVWANATEFIRRDTLSLRGRAYPSKTDFTEDYLLFIPYGRNELQEVSKENFQDLTFKTARYSPLHIIHYFMENKAKESSESNEQFTIYEKKVNQTQVKLYIRKTDFLVEKVSLLQYDELFGDVTTTIRYQYAEKQDDLFFPQKVEIEKLNGKVKDEVIINHISLAKKKPEKLKKPKGYAFVEEEKVRTEVKVEQYNEHLHFVELKHTDDRVLIVEFTDFLVVAEAPLNSENGELILQEARKIAPNKPVKYFVFGHYHPHYIGGMRPFVQSGAKIICSDVNEAYARHLAEASHKLKPDALQKNPKPIQVEKIEDKLTITDGNFIMEIYFIGEKSEHTKDYLVYYFPQEKILFQDDLVWIKKEGEIKKAGKRQAGLYNAIVDLGIEVETIVQSWPVSNRGVKTIIPFADLEASMK